VVYKTQTPLAPTGKSRGVSAKDDADENKRYSQPKNKLCKIFIYIIRLL
jgi:hypothetical protein